MGGLKPYSSDLQSLGNRSWFPLELSLGICSPPREGFLRRHRHVARESRADVFQPQFQPKC